MLKDQLTELQASRTSMTNELLTLKAELGVSETSRTRLSVEIRKIEDKYFS